jgi:hypothetical protein
LLPPLHHPGLSRPSASPSVSAGPLRTHRYLFRIHRYFCRISRIFPLRLLRPLLESCYLPCCSWSCPSSPKPGPSRPPEAADWWDLTAKPAIISFCPRFAVTAASRRYHLSRALELALEAQDWGSCGGRPRAHLCTLDEALAAGIMVRTHSHRLDQEEPGAFH